jgi:hypothetical protein
MAEQGINREIFAYKLRIMHEKCCSVGQHSLWGCSNGLRKISSALQRDSFENNHRRIDAFCRSAFDRLPSRKVSTRANRNLVWSHSRSKRIWVS